MLNCCIVVYLKPMKKLYQESKRLRSGKTARLISVFMLVLLTRVGLFAQEATILDNFTASENNGKIFLRWVITSGSTCNGTKIFRSTDNLSFTQIGEISGVCGSSSFAKSYDFIDESPVDNLKNHYRLELGNNGYSKVVSLEITDLQNGGYQVRPNPVTSQAKIYFKNKNYENHQLKIHNQNGSFISSSYSNDDYFDFDATNLQSGIYIFTISKSGKPDKLSGKIVVQH